MDPIIIISTQNTLIKRAKKRVTIVIMKKVNNDISKFFERKIKWHPILN